MLYAAPSSAPSNLMVEAISSIELLVTWDEVPLADQNGIIATYEVLSVPQTTFDDLLTSDIFNTTNMSLSLDDLHPNVNYTISIRAYTSVGPGPFETTVQLTPEDSTFYKNCCIICIKYLFCFLTLGPASPPVNVMTLVSTSTSIMVGWEEIPIFDQNGNIIAYEVFYEPLDSFDGEIQAETVNISGTFTILDGLEEFVCYNITIRAYTSAGPGPYSVTVMSMTSEDGKTSYLSLDIIVVLYKYCNVNTEIKVTNSYKIKNAAIFLCPTI